MRRAGDAVLLLLQWLLMLWGLALVVVTILEYNAHAEMQQGLSVSGFESNLSAPPIVQRLIQGVTTGLVAMRLSVTPFYLRRLNLLRQK